MFSSLKKAVIALILIPGILLAASPLNSGQLPLLIQVTGQLIQDAQALRAYAYNAQVLAASNYQFTVPGSNEVVQMTPQQQTDMYNAYTQLKANLSLDLQSLP